MSRGRRSKTVKRTLDPMPMLREWYDAMKRCDSYPEHFYELTGGSRETCMCDECVSLRNARP